MVLLRRRGGPKILIAITLFLDSTVRHENDTRTNPRLHQMNSFALNAFSSHGWGNGIDSLGITEMFVAGGESRDLAHWFGGAGMEAMIRVVGLRLGLGEEEGEGRGRGRGSGMEGV